MIKRKFYTTLGILLIFGCYWLALLPLLAIRANLDSRVFILALLVWGVVCGIFFIPAFAGIVRKVWFFRGAGEPVVQELLVSVLSLINDYNSPVTLKKHGKKLVLTWRYQEPKWCEHLEETGMKHLYELWLRFDNNTKTVLMTDRYRSVNWDLSPVAVRTGWYSFSRPFFNVETGDEWGIENYEDTRPEDYTYSPNEIKSPVLNSIIKNGWNVRFTLF